TYVYKKLTRILKRKINEVLFEANEKLFLKRRLYILACNQLHFIAIYIIPLSVNLGVLLHNFNLSENAALDDNPSLYEILKFNKSGPLDNKYTNFKNNYITNMKYI